MYREEEEEKNLGLGKNKNNENNENKNNENKNNKFDDGMTLQEINKIMLPIKYFCESINYNDLKHIKKYFINNDQKIFSFIMLIIKPKSNYGHFTACFIDINNYTCEYYD